MTNEVYEKQLAELSKFVNGDMKKIIESQREAIHTWWLFRNYYSLRR